MSLPTKADQSTLDYGYFGMPFVAVESKDLHSETLDYGYFGMPYFGAIGDAPAPVTFVASNFFMMF